MKRLMTAAAVAAALAVAAMPASAKNVLKWASQGDALTADPHSQNEGPTNAATLQIYESLVFPRSRHEADPGIGDELVDRRRQAECVGIQAAQGREIP